jgi:hypothetical protein
MDAEKALVEKVERYFTNLGYAKKDIWPSTRTFYGQEVDLVIYDRETPKIAVEIKRNIIFPKMDDVGDLKFHPYVRKTQAFAKRIGAPYYILTDGDTFLSFTTDEMGRPELLRSPIYPSIKNESKFPEISKNLLIRIFHELRELFYKQLGAKYIDSIAILIYAQLLSEGGDERLKQLLIKSFREYDRLYEFLPSELLNLRNLSDSNFYAEAFDILDRISFKNAMASDILCAIDEVFIYRETKLYSEIKLPRWLTSLIVHLAQFKQGKTVLDIHSSYGDVIAATLKISDEIRILSISNNPHNLLWVKIQRLVTGYPYEDFIVGNLPPYDVYESRRFSVPDYVVVTPPFGLKIDNTRQFFLNKMRANSEELYLELAIRWVCNGGRIIAIVPDSLLFAKSREYMRKFLLEKVRLTAVIGLGSFLPQSSIRASILVLDKVESFCPYEIFMSQIEGIVAQEIFNCFEIPQIMTILEAFKDWSEEKSVGKTSSFWVVNSKDLNVDNLTAGHYIPPEIAGYKDASCPYPMVPITEIASVYRGSSIKNDKNGNLQVIGPAAIRPKELDLSGLEQTDRKNLPTTPSIVQARDIVINLISTYRGVAAMVPDDLAGSIANRHVVVIRANSSIVLPEYLEIALNSHYVQQQFEKAPSGVVIPSINLAHIKETVIPLPEIETQREIVEKVNLLQNEWKQAEKNATDAGLKFRKALQNLGFKEESK